jgi:hypothetical protein
MASPNLAAPAGSAATGSTGTGSTGTTSSPTAAAAAGCSSIVLPAGGVVAIPNNAPVTLSHEAVFLYNCPSATSTPLPDVIEVTTLMMASSGSFAVDETVSGPGFSELRDPFYMTTYPIFYTLAGTTVIAYTLVIMLFIAPRSFVQGGVVYLGRRNAFTNGSTGVAFGHRPWFQKVACLTVAISLTIATGTTFKTVARHYSYGIVQNSQRLQADVMDGTPLKIIRLVSDTFLWLAQAQTLMHLYPKAKQKAIIKWATFALITLEIIFSALNSFQYANTGSNGNTRPRSFVDAIPALSYLFQLTMGLLYAAWVMYYIFTKRRYAFYHPLMKNMWLVALIGLIAILIPIVFFILDISKPQVAAWGDYVRWVGAAAASVMVWEWVERIETLESEQKKDNILGRQIHDDGGEVAEPSDQGWKKSRDGRQSSWSHRTRARNNSDVSSATEREVSGETNPAPAQPPLWPASAATPVSRADTGSSNTTYRLRQPQQLTAEPRPFQQQQTPDSALRGPEPTAPQGSSRSIPSSARSSPALANAEDIQDSGASPVMQQFTVADSLEANDEPGDRGQSRWRSIAQMASPAGMFTRRRALGKAPEPTSSPTPSADEYQNGSIRSKIQNFAVTQAERIQSKFGTSIDLDQLKNTVQSFPPVVTQEGEGGGASPPTRGRKLNSVDEEVDGGGGGGAQPTRVDTGSSASLSSASNRRPSQRILNSTTAAATAPRGGGGGSSMGLSSPSQAVSSGQAAGEQHGPLHPAEGRVMPPLWPGVETLSTRSRRDSLDSTSGSSRRSWSSS